MIAAAPAAAAKATNLRQAALVFLQTGDIAQAQVLSKRLEVVAVEAPSSYTRGCVHHVYGMLALAQRQAEPALTEFRRANAEYRSYLSHRGMARAFEPAVNGLKSPGNGEKSSTGAVKCCATGFPRI